MTTYIDKLLKKQNVSSVYKGQKIQVVLDRRTNHVVDVYAQDLIIDKINGKDYTVADLLKDNMNNQMDINKLNDKVLKLSQNQVKLKDVNANILAILIHNGLDVGDYTMEEENEKD